MLQKKSSEIKKKILLKDRKFVKNKYILLQSVFIKPQIHVQILKINHCNKLMIIVAIFSDSDNLYNIKRNILNQVDFVNIAIFVTSCMLAHILKWVDTLNKSVL